MSAMVVDPGWVEWGDGMVIVVMPCCYSPVALRSVEVHPRVWRRMACARCRHAWCLEFVADTEAVDVGVVRAWSASAVGAGQAAAMRGVAQRWRERAACRDMNTEVFFPHGTTGTALDQTDQAKAMCARCPVITECLEFALATNQTDGIWGGTTEDERRTLHRRRRKRQ